MSLYVGLFLIALSALTLEITLTRILSVITWYYMAFFAISTAMLGMTAGAVTVYLKRAWFDGGRLSRSLAVASLWYGLSVPVALSILCLLPLQLEFSVMNGIAFGGAALGCALPFYTSGIVVSAALTKSTFPTGKVYASDLLGAGTGCLAVLGGLELLDAPSLILLCGSVGALAAFFFTWKSAEVRLGRTAVFLFALLFLGALANAHSRDGIRPLFSKGKIDPPSVYTLEEWNSFSRVAVRNLSVGEPSFWGKSPAAPRDLSAFEYSMAIDGDAGTSMTRFRTMDDIQHLRYDVTNIVHSIRPAGNACIVGVGGGRDILGALLFGHDQVVGIDINPVFIRLLQKEFRGFAGLADRREVSLVVDDARSYLSQSPARFSVIQMSLIDTWAATGAGAFSLSENGLYTIEAWRMFLSRLKSSGVFTVSRWYSPDNVGETGRLLSLAVATLLEEGSARPSDQIALVTARDAKVATILVGRESFTPEDLKTLTAACQALQFELVVFPGNNPQNEILAKIVSARSLSDLQSLVASEPMNFLPPTDENPYFFNMARLGYLPYAWKAPNSVLQGNLRATVLLLTLIGILIVLSFVTIVLPLRMARRYSGVPSSGGTVRIGGIYFSMIGAGFMFLEIALLQRLSVFLGHPVYALGVLLFTLILSASFGSYLSEMIRLRSRRGLLLLPAAMVTGITAEHFGIMVITTRLITSALFTKILATVVLIMPVGILMGFFFPIGLRLTKTNAAGESPWFWALNGIFGVLCSAVAVFLSIYVGITMNFILAGMCYAGVGLALQKMGREGLAERGHSL